MDEVVTSADVDQDEQLRGGVQPGMCDEEGR